MMMKIKNMKNRQKGCQGKLTKNAEHRAFGLPKGTQKFWTEAVNADISHLQTACADLKMMTWTCFDASIDVNTSFHC